MCGLATARGDDTAMDVPAREDDGALPQPFNGEGFESLMTHPPFTRSLGVADSLILTGIARVEEDVFATLLDTETMKSHVVSKTANNLGWQLVGVGGNPAESHTWTAKIQIGGGQVVSVRYQKPPAKTARSSSSGGGGSGGNSPPLSSSQADEARRAAYNYREGFSSDGYPNAPPPQIVEKLSRISVSQREEINRQMLGLRNRGMSMDERRRIYESMVDRASQSRR
ncbi:MAG TPA: hypothetical protein DIT13_18480 [Verrucomicrobiales bacterium]|nr:hypothetical protein [Verrucomicrobiales bacterium]